MINKKNLLIICSNIKDSYKIETLDLINYKNVIVASDDLIIHEKLKKTALVKKIIFLQKSIAFPTVTTSVVESVDKVNNYFKEISKLGIFSEKEIFWNYHAAGHPNAQFLQDVLLSIESAHRIFNEYNIQELIVIGDCEKISTKIIIRLAEYKNYSINYYNKISLRYSFKFKDYIRPFYYLFKSILNKISAKKLKRFNNKLVILFQICGSTPKHIYNVTFLQDKLINAGLNPLNIIWGNSKQVKKMNQDNYNTYAIEYFLSYLDIFISLQKTIKVFKNLRNLKILFYKKIKLQYKGINFTDIISDSVMNYLYTQGPENYRYRESAKKFFLNLSPNLAAIKYCGPKISSQGTILSEIIHDKYLKFDYDLGVRTSETYTKYTSKKYYNFMSNNFIRFAPNDIEKQYMINDFGVSKDSIISVGKLRANKNFLNSNENTKLNFFNKLNIKKEYDIFALIEFSEPYIGFKSLEEIYCLLKNIIDFAKHNFHICFIIKPNYSTNLNLFNNIFENITDNIYFMDKKSFPDYAFNVVDIVFTKFSTVGLEALAYDVQVVSLSLDNDNIFKIYGNAAEYLSSEEELILFLKNNLYSKEIFTKWKNSFKEKRKLFIEKYYPKMEFSAESIIAKSLNDKIKLS